MPPITSAPSPQRFAEAWSRRFDESAQRTTEDDAPPSAESAASTLQLGSDRLQRARRLIDGGPRAALARAAQSEGG
jgi:hypothetical protein